MFDDNTFSICKCGSATCDILPADVLQQVNPFLDPMWSADSGESFLQFSEVYGKATTEKFRPSLKAKPSAEGKPFRLSADCM